MSNYTLNRVINQETGEIVEEYRSNVKMKYYMGPRKYWRIMELYDEIAIKLGSIIGYKILVFLKLEVDTTNYRISINQSWLAEDLDASRSQISAMIKKLIDLNAIKKEKRNKYFINPDLFWCAEISDKDWQELKQNYNDIK